MIYPRPLESIHQIEVSSRCNLKCVYCPSKDLDVGDELGSVYTAPWTGTKASCEGCHMVVP